MRLRFGLRLDGERGGQHPRNVLGEASVGPLGFLTILETQLGLLRPNVCTAERTVQYRRCLAEHLTNDRFYAATFRTDELGTAATLLAWRDLWYLHGWSGEGLPDAKRRLDDLQEIERSAATSVSPCLGQRLTAVLEVLRRRRPAIEEVLLEDAFEAFPHPWREVLGRLPRVTPPSPPVARGKGFLGELQARLLAADSTRTTEPLRWRDDGSVAAVRADTQLLAGRWLAERLRASASDMLLVAANGGAALDGILAASGLPREGFRDASGYRPALQVLPLALQILWEPLDFHSLIQFLTHPICPLPGDARRTLAAHLAERPGIGGARWQRAITEIVQRAGDRGAAVRAAIATWIEHPRHARSTGAPVADVLKRVRLLVDFFRVRLGAEDLIERCAFNAGYNQANAFASALENLAAQGVTRIDPQALQTVIAQATARGSDNPLLCAEVGSRPAVTDPGAIIDAFDQVIWWQPTLPLMPEPWPWSLGEIAALAAADVKLPTVRDLLFREAAYWLKPVLAARDRLTLVLPPEGAEPHPAWLMMDEIVRRIPVQPLEPLLVSGASEGLERLPVRPLPARRRWWALPLAISIPLPERASFSSLDPFLFNPSRWLLRYPASLERSRVLDIAHDSRLKGTLAHSLTARLYAISDALKMTPAQVSGWFGTEFDHLIQEEGAVLRMPGRRADLEHLRSALHSALLRLHRQLQAAKVRTIVAEQSLEGTFAGGALAGFADLVATKANGSCGLIDMKWSSHSWYRRKLAANEQLQLAVYGELLRQKNGAWPSVCYLIFDVGALLAQDHSWFPDADVVVCNGDERTPDLWQRFGISWAWRRKQLARGRVEVIMEGVEPTPESEPPAGGLAPQEPNDGFNEFRHLAGWDDRA